MGGTILSIYSFQLSSSLLVLLYGEKVTTVKAITKAGEMCWWLPRFFLSFGGASSFLVWAGGVSYTTRRLGGQIIGGASFIGSGVSMLEQKAPREQDARRDASASGTVLEAKPRKLVDTNDARQGWKDGKPMRHRFHSHRWLEGLRPLPINFRDLIGPTGLDELQVSNLYIHCVLLLWYWAFKPGCFLGNP
ncbi:hypothetical protein V8F06_000649 [Rhypophila decipiens]